MSYPSQCLTDGAVGLYELAEASGTVATDQAAHQNGVYAGTGVTYAQSGIPGAAGLTAVRFTAASNGNVGVADNIAQRITDVGTLEVWFKLVSTGTTRGLISGANSGSLGLRISSTGALTVLKNATSVICTATTSVTDTTTWHHAVATKNGSVVHLYLDGVDVTGTVTNATCLTTAGFYIGNDGSGDPYFDGYMQFGAIYPTALSSAIVSNHYSLGSTTSPYVTSVSPSSGSTAGGTSVTITGGNLTGATAVTFGATGATSYTVNSSTQITATSPAGSAGTVDITVTTANGTSATSSADQFTYTGGGGGGSTSGGFLVFMPGG